jgi:hypothetical protein
LLASRYRPFSSLLATRKPALGDQTSTKDRGICASLPPFAAVTNLLKYRDFASAAVCGRYQRAFPRRTPEAVLAAYRITSSACARCGIQWDKGANDAPCKPCAEPPITFADMIETLNSKAPDELWNQHALIKDGRRFEPDRRQLRLMSVLFAAARLIEIVRGDDEIVARLRAKGRRI